MKKLIESENYFLEIVYEPDKNKASFFIKAKDKLSNRYSYINNLNCILGLFGIDCDSPLAPESQWYISKKRAKIFTKIAIDGLHRKSFLSFLEWKLYEDRLCGEWENVDIT